MKNKSIIHLSLLLFTLTVLLVEFGCKKSLQEKFDKSTKPSKASNTKELQASSDFTFNTFAPVQLRFTPIQDDVRTSVFKVYAPDGSLVFQKLQKVSDPLEMELSVPNNLSKLTITFANVSKEVEISGGLVMFSLN